MDMKSFVACVGLVLLASTGWFAQTPASAAKPAPPEPIFKPDDDPLRGLERDLIRDVENEKYKVCDHFPGKGESKPPKKCKGLSP
jgi:hypothetical protein